VYQGTLLEGEDLFAQVAIGAVLMLGVFDGLGGELGGGDGDAVDAENQVERLVVFGAVIELTGEGETVGVIVLLSVGIHAVRGTEEGERKVLAEEIDAVAKDVERAAGAHGAGDFFEERRSFWSRLWCSRGE
jgi:hypothetical protein